MSGGNVAFNVAKGAFAEKVRDDATKLGVLLLKVVESDSALIDRATISAVVANSTEADFASYARKTSITGTLTVDNTNDRVDVDTPDQTWTAATTGQTLVKLVTFYDESGTDATRIPLTAHTFDVTTNGSDLIAQIAVFARAS